MVVVIGKIYIKYIKINQFQQNKAHKHILIKKKSVTFITKVTTDKRAHLIKKWEILKKNIILLTEWHGNFNNIWLYIYILSVKEESAISFRTKDELESENSHTMRW